MWKLLLIFACIPSFSAYVHADIFKYVTDDDVVVFTDIPTNKKGASLVFKTAEKNRNKKTRKKSAFHNNLKKYYPIVSEKAEESAIDPELIKAMITVESAWMPDAVSSKGAMGLMQLMPLTAQYLSVKNPFSPEENISGGVRYFRMLLDLFKGNLKDALAAYNAGPERVKRKTYFPEGSETRRYIEKILALYGGEQKFEYIPLKGKLSSKTVYKIMLEDGTLLFTDTPLMLDGEAF